MVPEVLQSVLMSQAQVYLCDRVCEHAIILSLFSVMLGSSTSNQLYYYYVAIATAVGVIAMIVCGIIFILRRQR